MKLVFDNKIRHKMPVVIVFVTTRNKLVTKENVLPNNFKGHNLLQNVTRPPNVEILEVIPNDSSGWLKTGK